MSENLLNIFDFNGLDLANSGGGGGGGYGGASMPVDEGARAVGGAGVADREAGEFDDDGGGCDESGYFLSPEEFEANDVRIAMIGNVDSGKSTLIGRCHVAQRVAVSTHYDLLRTFFFFALLSLFVFILF